MITGFFNVLVRLMLNGLEIPGMVQSTSVEQYGPTELPPFAALQRAVPLIGPTEDKVELPVVSQTTRILVIWMELEGYPTVTVSVGPVAGSGDSDIV